MRKILVTPAIRTAWARTLVKFLKETANVDIKHTVANRAIAALFGFNEHSLAAVIRDPGGLELAIEQNNGQIDKSAKRQLGDTGEALVLEQFTLAGMPASLAPQGQPGYDIIVEPPGEPPQRVQVKSRDYRVPTNFFSWKYRDQFDHGAFVLRDSPGRETRIFIAPRAVVDERSHDAKFRWGRSFTVKNISQKLAEYEDNFR